MMVRVHRLFHHCLWLSVLLSVLVKSNRLCMSVSIVLLLHQININIFTCLNFHLLCYIRENWGKSSLIVVALAIIHSSALLIKIILRKIRYLTAGVIFL